MVPLERKKKKEVGEGRSGRTGTGRVGGATGPDREGADQALAGPSREEGTTVPQEEGQGALPLVPVPFEVVTTEK